MKKLLFILIIALTSCESEKKRKPILELDNGIKIYSGQDSYFDTSQPIIIEPIIDTNHYFFIGYWFKKENGSIGNGSYQIICKEIPTYKDLTSDICKNVPAKRAIVLSIYEFENAEEYNHFNP